MKNPLRVLFAFVPVVLFMGMGNAYSDDHGKAQEDHHPAPGAHGDDHAAAASHGDDQPAPAHGDDHKPATAKPVRSKRSADPKPVKTEPSEPAHEPVKSAADEPPRRSTAPSKNAKPAKNAVQAAPDTPPTAEEARALLAEGNDRWVRGECVNPATDAERRERLAEQGQKPFVTVLACADSRIPVERVFDRGVGEVFVVRVAGNVCGDSEAGTVEYGVGHLKTPLLLVMGHTGCGAVAAACADAPLHGKVAGLVDRVKPAVARARRHNPRASEAELAAIAVRENVWQSIFDLLKESSEVRAMVSDGRLRVEGALYDIGTGSIDWLGEHPWQSELVRALNTPQQTEHATVSEEHGE
ncbi:MAG TPA: carbonic anhydrase [Phycisphaerales bacterium]|nr:carbonic anhydrase [Phycisphaerales bacterium]